MKIETEEESVNGLPKNLKLDSRKQRAKKKNKQGWEANERMKLYIEVKKGAQKALENLDHTIGTKRGPKI